jgi:hypothetical protein
VEGGKDLSKLEDFINYLLEQVENHSIYVWGAQGKAGPEITEAWIRSRETGEANAERAIAFWKKQAAAGYGNVLRAFDCSGLGMYYLQNLEGVYKTDMSANSMMGKCQRITREQARRGDWVFRVDSAGKAYHIGYIVDEALNAVEAKGRDDGVIKRHIDAVKGRWNAYGRPEVFAKEIEGGRSETPGKAAATVLKLTSPLTRGDGVKRLQEALNALGYDCGTADGVCGNKTMSGIRAFVRAHEEV